MNSVNLTKKELMALRHIRNSMVHRGRSPSIRELMSLMHYRSPHSISLIIDSLVNKGILHRKPDGKIQISKALEDYETRMQTIDVPLIGTVTCGLPVFAAENYEAMIPVSVKLARPPHKYFLLKVKGDSMNKKGINDGDIVLVRHQVTANNGDIVVALIDDETTVKEFNMYGDTIVLKPRSTNEAHKPIILTRDFQIQGIVVTSIPSLELIE